MKARQNQILREMGLAPLWRLRPPPAAQPPRPARSDLLAMDTTVISPASSHQPAVDLPTAPPSVVGTVPGEDWNGLISRISTCQACNLCQQRRQAVPGVGDRQADWLFVGEAPGAEEDQKGEPFVGQAGKLLDSMLSAMGLARGKAVYIANAVKCRPPHNRTPEAEEMAACRPFLARQIELIAPRIIIALGRPAAQTLLEREVKIAAARGRVFHYRDIPVVVTYHPAYLLRNPHDKAKAWEDLCFALHTMSGIGARTNGP